MNDPPPLLPAQPRPVRWGLGDALVAAAVGYATAIVITTTWLAATGDTRVTWGLTVLSTVGLWVGFLVVPWLVSVRKGQASLAADYGWRIEPKVDLLVGVAAALVTQFLVLRLVSWGFELIQPDLELTQTSQDMAKRVDDVRFAILALVFVVGAPLAEELFFRGLLLRSLVRRWGSTVGIVVSGVLFGLVHTEGGSAAGAAAVVTGLTLFGLLLGWLTERFGRMGPAIVAHIAFNLAAVGSLFFSR